jgi:L-alanine-DL-glutamate epimerase-like enolase superfamily enzyme
MLEIPVAGGEHQYDLAAFKTLLHSYAVDIAIIALAHVGGMIPWRRIAGPAAALHVPVCGRVIPEVHAHLLAAIPNAYRVEDVPRSAPILPAMPNLGYGCLVAPQAPGLGPALDEVAVSRHRVG